MFAADPTACDGLITDLTMPGMTGDTLSREMRRLRADIPLVICTGHVGWTPGRGLESVRVANKPLRASELATALRNANDR